MVFNSLQYALFLPVVFCIYWQLGRRGQNLLLLLASWLFYGLWDWRFLGLMWLTTAVDYLVGRYLAAHEDDRKRKRAFAISLGLNLVVLGFFKYFNFFIGSAVDLFDAMGIQANEPTLRILLPVGISFYTFHGISYTFDVYRRDIEPADNILDFAVFVAYFPQLVAGPIGRAHGPALRGVRPGAGSLPRQPPAGVLSPAPDQQRPHPRRRVIASPDPTHPT